MHPSPNKELNLSSQRRGSKYSDQILNEQH